MPYLLAGRGLGVLQYADLLAQANLQNCDPNDWACVSNNTAKQAAVEDFWVQHMATGVPDDTQLSFAPQTTQEVQEFHAPTAGQGGNVVDTRGVLYVSAPDLPPPQVQPPAAVPPPPAPVAKTPVPAASSSSAAQPSGAQSPAQPGAQGAPPLSSSLQLPNDVGGFSLSSVPWWGWAGAAAVAIFALGGHRG